MKWRCRDSDSEFNQLLLGLRDIIAGDRAILWLKFIPIELTSFLFAPVE